MTALVTGSNGLLGSALVETLATQGRDTVRCVVREGSDRRRLDPVARRFRDRVQVVTGSLSTRERILPLLDDVSVVFHVAASLRGAPADLFRDAVVTTRNLLDAVSARPTMPRVVLVSSFSVYGTARLRPGGTVSESLPLEPRPEERDAYSFAKLRQERLAWQYAHDRGIALTVVRPGVVYGRGVSPLSVRVGVQIGGATFVLGGDAPVPLSYVVNCAEAIAVAGSSEEAAGWAYNIHDDDLPTARELARRHRRELGETAQVHLPYPVTWAASWLLELYSRRSRGQLQTPLTAYKVSTLYRPFRYDNSRIKSLGWRQRVSTDEGLRRAYAELRGSR